MILYYAMGGGLGHLTRARVFLEQSGLAPDAAILTSSPHARDPRVTGGIPIRSIPSDLSGDRAGLRHWLERRLQVERPGEVILDAFPAGILGEWCGLDLPPGTTLSHVARLLRFGVYRKRLPGPLPRLSRVHVVEPLEPDHEEALRLSSDRMESLDLDPDLPSIRTRAAWPEDLPAAPSGRLWLVVHAGAPQEVEALLNEARREARTELVATSSRRTSRPAMEPSLSPDGPTIVVVSPDQRWSQHARPDVVHIDLYPARALFERADRIFSGAGFNVFRETRRYAHKHRFVPFPRRLDNQELRAARRAERPSASVSAGGSSP